MKTLIDGILKVEKEIASEKGSTFYLYGLFRRDDGEWDLVVSAPWLDLDEEPAHTRLIADALKRNLASADLIQIGGIFPLEVDEPFVQEVVDRFPSEGGTRHERNVTIHGMEFAEVHVFRALPKGSLTSHSLFSSNMPAAFTIKPKEPA